MVDLTDKTFISLFILTFFIVSYLSWIVFITLKEGRKALQEANKNSK